MLPRATTNTTVIINFRPGNSVSLNCKFIRSKWSSCADRFRLQSLQKPESWKAEKPENRKTEKPENRKAEKPKSQMYCDKAAWYHVAFWFAPPFPSVVASSFHLAITRVLLRPRGEIVSLFHIIKMRQPGQGRGQGVPMYIYLILPPWYTSTKWWWDSSNGHPNCEFYKKVRQSQNRLYYS